MEWSNISAIVLGIIGVLAAGFTIKTIISNRSKKNTNVRIVSQKNNTAGGDIVAGDSTKITSKK